MRHSIRCLGTLLFLTSFFVVTAGAAPKPPTENYHPIRFLDSRIEALKAEVLARPGITLRRPAQEIHTRAVRNDWLKNIYAIGLVEASDFTRLTSDKAIMGALIEAFTGEAGFKFHPKTMGLKYFLAKHKLVDAKHSLIRDRAKVEAALKDEFPHGYIVKPAAGINSYGKSKGFYFKMDKFVRDLLAEDSPVYQPADFAAPFHSELLNTVASGEFLILQENVVLAAGVGQVLQPTDFVEVRVHTFEKTALPEATFPRWAETKVKVDKKDLDRATAFVEDFLRILPEQFVARQAWSVDVAILNNGFLRLIDINTNRGEPEQWSGYMPRPGVLKAYTRLFEAEKNVHFAGFTGSLLRNGFGNYFKYLRKVYIDGIH